MFKSARVKLTAWYLLILMFITVSFSSLVYFQVVKNTENVLVRHNRKFQRRLEEYPGFKENSLRFEDSAVEETLKEVRSTTLYLLLIVNIFILLFAGSLSYWLAGLTLEPIEKMLQKQKDFVADAAHEFKTPLTALRTQLEVALRNKRMNLQEAKRVMESTLEDVESLSTLTSFLLKQSEYSGVYEPKEFSEISLKPLIEEVADEFTARIESKEIGLSVKCENIFLEADERSIRELLKILLDNALKFSEPGGKINIRAHKKGNNIYVEVEDEGIGIAQKDQPRIFDRFYKAEFSRSKDEDNGYGLGLSIAKEIVELHKGDICVKSELGAGTLFKVTLNERL